MESLSGSICIGNLVYHPAVDLSGPGFLIEEMKVLKLVGPSGNPLGEPKLIWSYGDVSRFLSKYRNEEESKYKIFSVNKCFKSIEECVDVLERFKQNEIEFFKTMKEDCASEVSEFEKSLKEMKKENKEKIRSANKKLSMLNSLSVKQDLIRKKMIDFSD